MSQPVNGVHDQYSDPFADAARAPGSQAVVLTSFVESIARWQHSRNQNKTDQELREAVQDRRLADAMSRAAAARQATAGLIFERAYDPAFLQRATLNDLGETWFAAEAYHRTDPRAAEAMDRVENRLFDRYPAHMVQYDVYVDQGLSRRNAMLKVVAQMDPGPPAEERAAAARQPDRPTARPTGSRAGALEARRPETHTIGTPEAPAAAIRDDRGAMVLVGSTADTFTRPDVEHTELRRLYSVHHYLGYLDDLERTRTQKGGGAAGVHVTPQAVTDARERIGREIVRLEILLNNPPGPEPETADAMRKRASAVAADINLRLDALADTIRDFQAPLLPLESLRSQDHRADTVGTDPDARLAHLDGVLADYQVRLTKADDARRAAATDNSTPDNPTTKSVDEHLQGVDAGHRRLGDAEHYAAGPRTAPELAAEGFPQPAAVDVAAASAQQQPPAKAPRKSATPARKPTPSTGG